MDKVTGMMRQEEKSSRDQMETVTCMSLEEMEWSISIAELEEVQECGDVIYLIVMVYIPQSIYIYLGTPRTGIHHICNIIFPKPKNRTIEISSYVLHSGLRG